MVASEESFTTGGEAETRDLGHRLAERLRPGDVVGLSGPLGAGKTVLVRGLCEGLGVRSTAVTSPSFAIVNTYRGRVPVLHVDLYRVADLDEVEATGLFDLLDDSVAVIEWADRVPALMDEEMVPGRVHRVEIADLGGDQRRITLRVAG